MQDDRGRWLRRLLIRQHDADEDHSEREQQRKRGQDDAANPAEAAALVL